MTIQCRKTMAKDTLSDDEWQIVQEDLRAHIETFREVYGDDASKNAIYKETDEYIILADDSGHELREIAEINGVDRSSLSIRMHSEARNRTNVDGPGDPWGVTDPIVILKN